MLIENLAKASSNNHGLELSPLQVQELMDALVQMQTQGALLQHRLDLATRVIEVVLVHDFDGELHIKESMLKAADQGFWMRHDKETEVISLGVGPPPEEVVENADYEVGMEVPEVQPSGDDVRGGDGDSPSVPEDEPQDSIFETPGNRPAPAIPKGQPYSNGGR